MNLATVGMVVIASIGALILGMAALIKTMVLGKLDDIQKELGGLGRDMHRIDIRVTRLEAERSSPHRCYEEVV